MQEYVNLWESWKFYFILKNSETIELGHSKQKENKIREYIYHILEKINDKFDFMPDLNLDEDIPAETFPYEIKINTSTDDSVFLTMIKNIGIKSVLNDEI
jgi:hypothetical protein